MKTVLDTLLETLAQERQSEIDLMYKACRETLDQIELEIKDICESIAKNCKRMKAIGFNSLGGELYQKNINYYSVKYDSDYLTIQIVRDDLLRTNFMFHNDGIDYIFFHSLDMPKKTEYAKKGLDHLRDINENLTNDFAKYITDYIDTTNKIKSERESLLK